MKQRFAICLFCLFFVSIAFSACATEPENEVNSRNIDSANNDIDQNETENVEQHNETVEEQPEEITLLFMDGSEASFDEHLRGPLEETFPHITFDFMEGTSHDFEEIITAGTLPDIFRVENTNHVGALVDEYGMDQPLDELIERHNFDLTTIQPTLIESMRSQHPDGALLALPFNQTTWATFYNKDIFDLFGEPYPKDGMTWNEIIDVAVRVTGEQDGIQYRGLDVDIPSDAFSAYPVNATDPDTAEVLIADKAAYQNYFEMIERITSIPGNYPNGADHFKTWGADFLELNVAMMPYWGPGLGYLDNDQLNWDMVTYPVWEDQPGVGPLAAGHPYAISPYSDYQDEAFHVIAYIASKEYQLIRSREGVVTPLVDTEVQEALAADVTGAEDINLQAVFQLEYSAGPERRSRYDEFAAGMWGQAQNFVESDVDVQTFLRQLQEESEISVQEGIMERGWEPDTE